VFIDIDATYNLCPVTLEQWLVKNTTKKNGRTYEQHTGFPVAGIVAVNLFGQCANYTDLRALAKEYNLWIIEDAAQSVGSFHNDQPSGTLGDISCFSFYPTKNLGGVGDGGMLTTQSQHIADRLRKLRNHGRASHYVYEEYGVNSRLDALQAVVLQEKLTHLPRFIDRRKKIAALYTQEFSSLVGIQVPVVHDYHTYHQYSIQICSHKLQNRTTFIDHLNKSGIGSCIYYPEPLNTIPYLKKDERLVTACPRAENVCKTIVSLPIWPELTDEHVLTIIKTVKSFITHPVTPRSTQEAPCIQDF